ncbi:MAG: transposase [Ferrimicrobium sp.]
MSGIGRPRGLSMQDFFSRYGTEDQCREALFAKRWPNGFVCPRCAGSTYYTRSPKQFMCASCRHITSLTYRYGDAPHAAEPPSVVHGHVPRRRIQEGDQCS